MAMMGTKSLLLGLGLCGVASAADKATCNKALADAKTKDDQSLKTKLDGEYADLHFAGATELACSFIAWDEKNQKDVIVKLPAKEGDAAEDAMDSMLFSMQCKTLDDKDKPSLLKKACEEEDKIEKDKNVDILRKYVPNCLEFGAPGDGAKTPYEVFEAAKGGPWPLLGTDLDKSTTSADKATIVAQLIEAIYILHKLGFGHNNLRPDNLRLNVKAEGPPRVSMDFGDGAVLPFKEAGHGYKRDANAIWERTASLLGCKTVNTALDTDSEATEFIKCLKDKLAVTDEDQDFLDKFEEMCKAGNKGEKNQHVQELYKKTFVQKALEKVQETEKDYYQWTCPESETASEKMDIVV